MDLRRETLAFWSPGSVGSLVLTCRSLVHTGTGFPRILFQLLFPHRTVTHMHRLEVCTG